MLQYLIVLAGTDPLVWRRIRVPATYTFWDFHVAIQDAMGWADSHLHQFQVVDPRSGTTAVLGIPDPDLPTDRSVTPEWQELLLDYAEGDHSPIRYTYDFGDDWQHAVIFEGFEQADRRRKKPQCVGGFGACPPEDSGGPYHYAMLLDALADPDHPDHYEFLESYGRPFDPLAFSVKGVRFHDPKQRWRQVFGGGAI